MPSPTNVNDVLQKRSNVACSTPPDKCGQIGKQGCLLVLQQIIINSFRQFDIIFLFEHRSATLWKTCGSSLHLHFEPTERKHNTFNSCQFKIKKKKVEHHLNEKRTCKHCHVMMMCLQSSCWHTWHFVDHMSSMCQFAFWFEMMCTAQRGHASAGFQSRTLFQLFRQTRTLSTHQTHCQWPLAGFPCWLHPPGQDS